MRMTREFYRPSESLGATMETAPDVPGSEIYRYTNRLGRPVAEVFGGKRAKPDFYIQFQTEERREAKIEEWIAREIENDERRKTRRIERNAGHTLKVGDALHASWGYDQTNADFWQVVGVPSKCYVEVRKIAKRNVSSSDPSMSQQVVPVKDAFLDDDRGGKAKRYKAGPRNSIRVFSFSNASKTNWETSHYETGWACGH